MKKISIGILTYNHEHFIEDCLRSVLSSNYTNLEIIISDDCSKDATVNVIERVLSSTASPHVIVVNKNEINLGLAENFNKVFGKLATGDFLITLGGDDIIKEDYLQMAISYFEKDPRLMMLDFNADIIDEHNHVTKPASSLGYQIKFLELKNYLALEPIPSFAPGRMIRKDLIKSFEPISATCPTEDSVLVLRALLLGKFARLDKDIILYRRHQNNISQFENLKKLSNASIVTQYFKDTIYLYHNQKISEIEIGNILDRLNFEYYRREYIYGKKVSKLKKLQLNLRKYLLLKNKI